MLAVLLLTRRCRVTNALLILHTALVGNIRSIHTVM